MEFTARVDSLEYLNADNIAISYLSILIEDYDVKHARPKTGKGMTKTLYYNPESNALRNVPWPKITGLSSMSEGSLCPAMQRMPRVGSFTMESLAVLVNLGRFVFRLVLGLPAMLDMYRKGIECPQEARGHSLLENCGAELFSLDETFDSIETANTHFWGIFHTIASRVRDLHVGKQDTTSNTLADVISGAAMYGQSNNVAVVGAVHRLMMGTRTPISVIASTLLGSVQGFVPKMLFSDTPLEMARCTYNLIAGCITRLVPTVMSASSRGSNGADLSRLALSIVGNEMMASRDEFNKYVVGGAKRSCNGVSLMMGYNNPLAVFFRKGCEAYPESMKGIMSVGISLTFVLPFVTCICVDAKGTLHSFERHAVDNCLFFAPDSLKPFVMQAINIVRNGGSHIAACRVMIEYATEDMKGSLQPMFSSLYQSSEALSGSVDYVMQFTTTEVSQCWNYNTNAYASVLMPEPSDFWNVCGTTEMCRSKCYGVVSLFENALASYKQTMLPGEEPYKSKTIERTVESKMFLDTNRDSVLPFNVLAMVELLDCSLICGTQSEGYIEDFVTIDTPRIDLSRDTCVAVAGISESLELQVAKYCIPRAPGQGVRRQEDQTWTVSGSNDFIGTIMQVFFADTVDGDTLIVFRDNTASKHGGNDIITVHPRSIQVCRIGRIPLFVPNLPDPIICAKFAGSRDFFTDSVL